MDVILLDRVPALGGLGDVVKVKPGYARNFLIPQGIALRANKHNLEAFEARRAELERVQGDRLNAAQKRADSLAGVALEIRVKAGDEGKLFGSVGAQDIVAAAAARDIALDRGEVRLQDGPLRMLGDYQVELRFHTDVSCAVTVSILAE